MAHIDNLIESIKDESLRAALRAEYRKVTKGRQFGLVFDPHKPESVLLPKFKVRRGDKVRILREGTTDRTAVDDSGVWIVSQINTQTGVAAVQDGDGRTRVIDRDRLVVTREFGDPIYPGLQSVARVQNGDADRPWHSIINAENYHALEALLYPYEGRVDAIYIDPPYNTGARDWKYNNDYVDTTDEYRHSKWLSFMERRLKLAKRLLNPTNSVLIVTIDEKEVHRLGMLLEQVFPAARIQQVTSVISSQASVRDGSFARCEEFIFFVMFGTAEACRSTDDMLNEGLSSTKSQLWFQFVRTGKGNLRADRKGMFYPIFANPNTGAVVSVGDPIALDVDKDTVEPPDGAIAIWPETGDGREGRWRTGPEVARARAENGLLRLGRTSKKTNGWSVMSVNSGTEKRIQDGEVIVEGFTESGAAILKEVSGGGLRNPKTVWNKVSHNAGWHGSKLVAELLPGRSFPYPKSLYAVEDALRFFVKDKPEALVVDFFGGSGTTAHAVMRLNRQDGGERRSIVVTNNEVGPDEAKTLRKAGLNPGDPEWEARGIAEYITWPRMKAAVTGLTPNGAPVKGEYKFADESPMADGFGENVEFFELTYEDPALVSLGRRFHAIAPLLWLKAGARGGRIDEIDNEQGWTVPEDATYGVLFDITQWAGFVEAVQGREDAGRPLSHAFVVSDSVTSYQQVVSRLSSSLDTTRLYADYLRTFEINTTNEDEVALVPLEPTARAQ